MKKYLVFFSFLFALNACRVSLVPDYDSETVSQLSTAAKACDKLLLQAQESEDRSYSKFKEKYIDAQAELYDLLRKEQNRIKGEKLTEITNNIITEFLKYKERHRVEDGAIKPAVLELEREYLSDHFNILLAAEKALK